MLLDKMKAKAKAMMAKADEIHPEWKETWLDENTWMDDISVDDIPEEELAAYERGYEEGYAAGLRSGGSTFFSMAVFERENE